MSKYTEKTEHISDFSHLENVEIPTENALKVYYPNWDNRPTHESVSVKAKNTETILCKTGGHICLTAGAGVGKSSVVEAIVSSVLNPDCDSLGIQVKLPEFRQKILLLDTERSQGETWDAWDRVMRRTSIETPNTDDRLIFANCKALSVEERKKYVAQIISENTDIGLIVFDGVSDFVKSINDEKETTEFNEWLNYLNPESLITIIHTIHTNPTDNKPRGWLGSELWRRANSVLLVRKIDDSGVVELTSNFLNGKVRHGSPFNHSFSFDTDLEMFLTTNHTPKAKKVAKNEDKWLEMAIKIFGGKETMYFADIVRGIEKETGKSYDASKQTFNRHFKDKICSRIGTSGWEIIEGYK